MIGQGRVLCFPGGDLDTTGWPDEPPGGKPRTTHLFRDTQTGLDWNVPVTDDGEPIVGADCRMELFYSGRGPHAPSHSRLFLGASEFRARFVRPE